MTVIFHTQTPSGGPPIQQSVADYNIIDGNRKRSHDVVTKNLKGSEGGSHSGLNVQDAAPHLKLVDSSLVLFVVWYRLSFYFSHHLDPDTRSVHQRAAKSQ